MLNLAFSFYFSSAVTLETHPAHATNIGDLDFPPDTARPRL
jgi:hypothetical protein